MVDHAKKKPADSKGADHADTGKHKSGQVKQGGGKKREKEKEA